MSFRAFDICYVVGSRRAQRVQRVCFNVAYLSCMKLGHVTNELMVCAPQVQSFQRLNPTLSFQLLKLLCDGTRTLQVLASFEIGQLIFFIEFQHSLNFSNCHTLQCQVAIAVWNGWITLVGIQ